MTLQNAATGHGAIGWDHHRPAGAKQQGSLILQRRSGHGSYLRRLININSCCSD
jgi:hypothetical protein